jgi:hypothetical protein
MMNVLEIIRQFFAPEPTAVMAWVQFIPMIAGAASSLFGGIQQGRKNREMKKRSQAMFGKMNADNEALFNEDYYSDYLQRADAQNVIRQMRDQFDRQAKRDENTAVITGATPESQAAAKNARAMAMSNLFGNLGAMGQRFKDNAKERYTRRKNALQDAEYNAELGTLARESESAGNLLYNGIGSLAGTDWASILGGKKQGNILETISPSVGANISATSPYATVKQPKIDGIIPATNPFK